MAPSVVTICGTSRPGNYTSHALAVVDAALSTREIAVQRFDAERLTLAFPGTPPTPDGQQLKQAITDAAGVIFATPEYHGTFSAMTKLIIESLGFPSVLSGKAVGLVGVAAGRIGAVKSLEQLRGVMAHTGAVVMPFSVSIAGVRNAFSERGEVRDEGSAKILRDFAASFAKFLGDYVCPRAILEAMAREGEVAPWSTAV